MSPHEPMAAVFVLTAATTPPSRMADAIVELTEGNADDLDTLAEYLHELSAELRLRLYIAGRSS